jgi:prepilin-type processing-associated H-X9-DG protein
MGRKNKKFLIIGVGFALASFLALAILMALSILNKVKMETYRQHDIGRLKNFGLAFHMYADSYDDRYPSSLVEFAQSPSGMHPSKGYICPSQPDREITIDDIAAGRVDYVYIGSGLKLSPKARTGRDPVAGRTVVMHTRPGILDGWISFLFLDGHAEGDVGPNTKEIAADRGWTLGKTH